MHEARTVYEASIEQLEKAYSKYAKVAQDKVKVWKEGKVGKVLGEQWPFRPIVHTTASPLFLHTSRTFSFFLFLRHMPGGGEGATARSSARCP